MSVKAMGRVWDSDLPPNLRLVLLAYADAAEHDGTQSYPGWERLVHMTGYSRSQVSAITRQLIDLGVLIQVKAGHRGQRAEFAIDFTALAKVSEPRTQTTAESVRQAEHSDSGEVSDDATHSGAESVASEGGKVSGPGDTSRPRPVQGDLLPTVVDHAEGMASRRRRRDPIWDTLVEIFEEPTNDATRGRRNRAVKLLRQSGATPEEIRLRVQMWPLHFEKATLTDIALANRWDELGRPPMRARRTDIESIEDAARRRQRLERAAQLEAERRGLPA